MVKYSNFTAEEDKEFVHYLADPSRVFQDVNSLKTYEALGPGSEYGWSHGHKHDGWARRAAMLEDIDGHILREARRIAKRQKNDLTTVEKKPKSSKERKPAGSKAFDVEDDIARLAEETRFTVELVREIFRFTKSIVAAGRMLEELSLSARGAMAHDELDKKDEFSSEEEEEVPIVVKKETKPRAKAAPKPALKKLATKRKRDEEDEDEEDDAPPVVKREKRAAAEKKSAAPARKTQAKKPVSRAKTKTVKYVEADSDSDSEEEEDTRPAKDVKSEDVKSEDVDEGLAIPANRFYTRLRPRVK
ncbi:hypothetical protein DFH06DRAFT_1485539 [Mycena polygramma]|nr:hypothetical protein DFH06DRAFT_1485539 [Mycena polygramma]